MAGCTAAESGSATDHPLARAGTNPGVLAGQKGHGGEDGVTTPSHIVRAGVHW